ncbi:nucleotidyltransferase family protein [Parapedobacter tibetensis]|uniref:nucleotidyltransferase family protein n=1 Tax=Parapedobacter tibetensis TaxID=2972951 RepID=UPI00214DD795|nr:nucleotidyltransferase domain-containing protein [Parapedobacter tibetensis]
MNIQTDLADKLPSLSSLCEEHSVEKMYAFGSVCSDEFTPQSDVDLLVTFKDSLSIDAYADNYFSFKEKLESLLKRHVDLIIERTLRNPYLIKAINKTKTLIYA